MTKSHQENSFTTRPDARFTGALCNYQRSLKPAKAIASLAACLILGTSIAVPSSRAIVDSERPSKPLLLFEIDEGFSDGLLGRYQDDPGGMDPALSNIRASLAPLARDYEVAVLVYPCQGYIPLAASGSKASALSRVRPALRHLLDFFGNRPAGAPRIGVFLEAYSSGVATEQSGELDRRPAPLLGSGVHDHGRLGLSMDMNALGALGDAYPGVLRGIRFHEVYGSDCAWKIQTEGPRHGFEMDAQVVRGCIDLCRRKRLRLIWSDSNWLMKPPTTGEPHYVYSASHRPYVFSEPYRSLQDEAERQLGSLICFSWANNNYHFTPNLEFLDSKVGPSAPGVNRPMPSWLYFDMPYSRFPLKGRAHAKWGMSIQSWFWHELTNTLTSRYYVAGELACPVEILSAYVRNGLREHAAVLQFEPTWYLFNERMHDKPDYLGAYEQKPDYSEKLALKRLKRTLLIPAAPASEPDRLDAIFDRNQQRFHENDVAHPPRNYAQSTLGLIGFKPGSKASLSCFDFYSFGPRWLRQDADRLGPWLFAGAQDTVQRVELDGDGVDELLVLRREPGGARRLTFYNQSSGLIGEDASIANDNAEGAFVGLTTANLLPEVVGQGDPDEIVVARRPVRGSTVNLRVYKVTGVSDDRLSFHYAPLPDEQNRKVLAQFVDSEALRADSFVGMTGLRSDAGLSANGTRGAELLVVVTRGSSGLIATVKQNGKTDSTALPQIPQAATKLSFCGIDEQLAGSDSLCFVWKEPGSSSAAGAGFSIIYRRSGAQFTAIERRQLSASPAFEGESRAFSLRKRILLNAGH